MIFGLEERLAPKVVIRNRTNFVVGNAVKKFRKRIKDFKKNLQPGITPVHSLKVVQSKSSIMLNVSKSIGSKSFKSLPLAPVKLKITPLKIGLINSSSLRKHLETTKKSSKMLEKNIPGFKSYRKPIQLSPSPKLFLSPPSSRSEITPEYLTTKMHLLS